jgi:hypothetical protein
MLFTFNFNGDLAPNVHSNKYIRFGGKNVRGGVSPLAKIVTPSGNETVWGFGSDRVSPFSLRITKG